MITNVNTTSSDTICNSPQVYIKCMLVYVLLNSIFPDLRLFRINKFILHKERPSMLNVVYYGRTFDKVK